MALSLLTQFPSFSDLQTFFDTTHTNTYQQNHNHQQEQQQQQQYQQQDQFDQMEYNNQSQYHQNVNNNCHNRNSDINHSNSIHNNNNNNNNSTNNNLNNNNNNNNNNNSNHSHNNSSTSLSNQHFTNTNRNYNSGYHHQHISADYETVINFIDSPPNSEESWTGSPGPQIIDVQTIYSNNGSRKRRMDWDSLDIDQSGNTATTAQTDEIPNKITSHDKERHKREKLGGRGSWADDIGFDLNAEFNSNSYLNNEFLSFSPNLTVLKQEPQTEQLKVNKSLLNSNTVGNISKTDKSTSADDPTLNNQDQTKNEVNDKSCSCGSPQSTQQGFEQNLTIVDKRINDVPDFDNSNAPSAEKTQSQSNVVVQQLSVIDANKIENLPIATTNSDDHKFQYILAAATSIATKNNEETLTYLNQSQSYEIKLKKIGDLSYYRDKILKSVIKICFHERRLQFMEREQMQQWQASRPGERIIEVDVPLSYGLCHVSQPLNQSYLNTVEIFWDPLKEVGVYIKVNCISTEFTAKKHGGEKGVPFRLQIETYIENPNGSSNNQTAATQASPNGPAVSPSPSGTLTPTNNLLVGMKQPVHAAACQIKVFKLKGADRKHKQDREKIQKRSPSEQEKFQPSYECTIMNDIPLDLITSSAGCYSPEYMKIWPNSPVHIPKYDGILPFTSSSPATANSSPIQVTSTNSPSLKLMEANMVSPQQVTSEVEEYTTNITPETTPVQVTQWLTNHRLTAYLTTFTHFSGSDILRMSKEDLIQICGLADGIRMFNILRAKAIKPRLTIYVSIDGHNYNAIYLIANTSKELTQKLVKIPGFYEMVANSPTNNTLENGALYNNWSMHSKYSGSGSNIFNDANKNFIYVVGPSGIHVTVTDEVLNNEINDGSLYALEVQSGKVVMKFINKNEN
ncbi:upstream-binding protein 1-like isoform X2 [Teleopsis dalmanni]|uniref:upstream-binding protein 1-like isoform X2 n=1 Tax=Teleopsis dalmanni TaxID=139649 RepID=UPI0018CC80FF|nr:upstream-binding protein 1-like isoform X2 [Teleopsis dalmanni]